MLRPSLVVSLSILVAAGACGGSEQPSRLQQRDAAPTPAAAGPAKAEPTKAEPTKTEPTTADPGKLEPAALAQLQGLEGKVQAEPPPGAELVSLRLALPEGASYRVTTLGNLQFGSMMQPTAFAREERLSLSGCAGEGAARTCALEHRFVHFEAEPPAGQFLINDENEVRGLVTRHTIKASGERVGPTAIVDGPKEQAESPEGKALVELDQFFCVRFPEQPIAVGAKWRATCHQRTSGVVDTRDVLWELDKLDRDPKMGLRAELSYLGKYIAPGPKGTLEGVIRGTMYFFVDAGAPHLIREEFTMARDAASQFVTHTTLAHQFALLIKDKGGKETAVRVDGELFPEAPATGATGLMSPASPASPAEAAKADGEPAKG